MKAAVCRGFGEPLAVEEIEIAGPRSGEIKVRLAACAICHSDIHAIEGAWGGDLPAVHGHEAAGVVEAVGPAVTAAAPGDHVVVSLMRACGDCYHCRKEEPYFCERPPAGENPLRTSGGEAIHQGFATGAFAEYAVVDQSQVVRVPEEVPLDSACLLACGVITGLGAVVNTARVPAGSHVAVIGTGGVGLNSVQGAAFCEAESIVAVDLSDAKLEAARAFGATHAVNAARDSSREVIDAVTQGRGADYVFVTVGSVKATEDGIGLLRRGGTLVVVGMPPEGAMAAFEPVELSHNGWRILGSKMGSTRFQAEVPKLVELYRDGRLKLDELISGRYPLARINEAIADVTRAEALRNVIVF